MDFEKLRQWGKQTFKCECGLITHNSKKKEHLNSETHFWLSNYNYENVTGKSLIICGNCNDKVMVCGFASHMKKCLNI